MNDTASTDTFRALRKRLDDLVVAVDAALRDTTAEGRAECRKAGAVLGAELSAAKSAIDEHLQSTAERAREADRLVHAKPWLAVAVGAGVGMLLGLLLRRR